MLCLDADRAGQDAMLRAAQLTDQRKLELRVVPLPDGTDPAELIERAGADALRERVAASVPFVAFHVERILERSDTRSAEGRDRAFRQLLPALKGLARDAFGEELLRRVAGRLELSEARLGSLIEGAARQNGAGASAAGADATAAAATPSVLDQGATRRADVPGAVHRAPGGGRADAVRDRYRAADHQRAAAPRRAPPRRPDAVPAGRPARGRRAAREDRRRPRRGGRAGRQVSDDQLEHARLVLEQARLDRAIRRAKTEGGTGIAELAREREAVMAARRTVYARLEKAV